MANDLYTVKIVTKNENQEDIRKLKRLSSRNLTVMLLLNKISFFSFIFFIVSFTFVILSNIVFHKHNIENNVKIIIAIATTVPEAIKLIIVITFVLGFDLLNKPNRNPMTVETAPTTNKIK